MSASVASSIVMVATMPPRLIAPRNRMIFEWPPGVASWMRWPLRQRPRSLVIEVVTPLSSREIGRSGGVARMRSMNC
jgi:hypothetical protein